MPATLTRVADVVSKLSSVTNMPYPPLGIASGFTCTRGDLVKLSSGTIVQFLATSATSGSGAAFAIANETVPSGTATATQLFIEVPELSLVCLPFADSTAGSVGAPGGVTWNNDLVGSEYAISCSSGGIYYIDHGVTANPLVAIVGYAPIQGWSSSDTFYAVLAKPLGTGLLVL
jgi:hypothetical protein